MNWPNRKWLDKDIESAVIDVLHHYQKLEQDLPAHSYYENSYCNEFSLYQGGGLTCAVNSGTNAAYVALKSLELRPSDIVLSSPVTDFGTISAIILNQLKILVADSKKDNFNTSLPLIKQAISDNHSKIKAFVLTHSAGDPIHDISAIANFCRENDIKLIEDCSQAHGAFVMVNDRPHKVGTFGDIAIFSTMHSKNHSTGGAGGLIFTRDQNLYQKIRSYSDRGKLFHKENFNSKDPNFVGYPSLNFGTNEISCAIGRVNLDRLDSIINKRRKFLQLLNDHILEKKLPFRMSIDRFASSPYFCPLLITDQTINHNRLKENLVSLELPCNTDYSFLPAYWNWAKEHIINYEKNPNALEFKTKSFNLLFNENFGEQECEEVVSILERAILNEN